MGCGSYYLGTDVVVISGFGITLHLLQEDHLEQLRTWRNSEFVQSFMQFREHITEQMQKKWFDSLAEKNSFYFMIHNGEEFIGCCNIKDIDVQSGVGEGGVFLGEERFLKGMDAIRAVFLMYHWGFANTQLQKAICQVLNDNPRAIKLNKMLGFTMIQGENSILHGQLEQSKFEKVYNNYQRVLGAI